MNDKKQLNEEDLEKASGGTFYRTVEALEREWKFNIGDQVYVLLEDYSTQVEARITKMGYTLDDLLALYADRYYIESSTNPGVNGWYMGGSNWTTSNITYISGRVYSPVTVKYE